MIVRCNILWAAQYCNALRVHSTWEKFDTWCERGVAGTLLWIYTIKDYIIVIDRLKKIFFLPIKRACWYSTLHARESIGSFWYGEHIYSSSYFPAVIYIPSLISILLSIEILRHQKNPHIAVSTPTSLPFPSKLDNS